MLLVHIEINKHDDRGANGEIGWLFTMTIIDIYIFFWGNFGPFKSLENTCVVV